MNNTIKRKKTPQELRSQRWLGSDSLRSFTHRSRAKQMGYAREDYADKPVIAIINTWSDLTTCHGHFRERAEEVKRGVWQAGGFPVEIPAMPVNETYMKPSPMMYRNFLAMEVEELLRCQPIDGVVLMGGCDKTTPGLLMGAISMNLPAIYLPAGPMLRGNWNGQILGSGSDVWKYWAEKCAGTITDVEWNEMEDGIARSPGHCMTMGTASTMTSIAEAMGMTLPGASSIPAVDANHQRMATACGRRIVEMVWEDLKPGDILTMRIVRERDHHGYGHRRFDKRHHSPGCDGRTRRHQTRLEKIRRDFASNADDRQHPSIGATVPDGGFILRRRVARVAQSDWLAACILIA